jgi:hypothetical protein
MGFFKRLSDNLGHTHIVLLTRDCSNLIINNMDRFKSLGDDLKFFNEEAKKRIIGATLDLLIEEGHYNILKKENIKDVETKFKRFHEFFVVRNLGRPIDYSSDDMNVLYEAINSMWSVFMNKIKY